MSSPPGARTSLVAIAAALCACSSGSSTPPNVLLYVADTLRADALGCYGAEEVATPTVDRLAAEGTLFERAVAPSSWTRASMGSLLTGLAPAVHGAEGRYHLMQADVTLASELFRDAGYATACITTNRNVGAFFGFDQGWDLFLELYEGSDQDVVRVEELTADADEVTERALAWVDAAREPFFLVVHTIDPHAPYQPPEGWTRHSAPIDSEIDGSMESMREIDQLREPPELDRAKTVALYRDEVEFNDHGLGLLVSGLEEREMFSRTLTVFTSDHGEELWERGVRGHGRTVNEMALRVPLVLRFPGVVEAGARRVDPVSTAGVLPTILDLVGLATPDAIERASLLGGEGGPLFSSTLLRGRELFAVRDGRWKLVWNAKTGRRWLYDLDGADVEGDDLSDAQAEITERLAKLLEQNLAAERARRERLFGSEVAPRVDELPDDLEEHLEELGYAGYDE